MRPAGRSNNQVRPVTLNVTIQNMQKARCWSESGDTKVLCTASIEEGVPRFRKVRARAGSPAEYGMLPTSDPHP